MSQFDDDGDRRGGGFIPWIPAVVLPFATAIIALVGGLVLGGAGVYVLRPADVRTETQMRDLTANELEAACQPLVAKVTDELNRANDQVTTLVGEVRTKEAKVVELETEMKRRGAAGATLRKQLDTARTELAEAKRQLQVAINEKEELVVQLKSALVELDTQKVKTLEAKQEAFDNGWQAFVNAGQLDICEKGTRKKLGRCREAVVDILAPMKDNYQYCLRTGQAMPSLQEAEKRQDEIPQFARWLDQDNRILKGWYIQLCDPTLPEARDYAAVARPVDSLQPAQPTEPGKALVDMPLATDTKMLDTKEKDLLDDDE